MKNLLVIFILIIAVSCVTPRQKCYNYLRKYKYKWDNLEKVLNHYSIDLDSLKEFYLIQTSSKYLGHFGCFYIGDKKYGFNFDYEEKHIEYEEVKYHKLFFKSLKSGKMDTLVKLSNTLEHMVFGGDYIIDFISYKNNRFRYYILPEFVVELDTIGMNFLNKVKKSENK
jgi:hypothetical protein